ARIAVPWLTDRARIEQCLAARELDGGSLGREPALQPPTSRERERNVAMSDEDELARSGVEGRLGHGRAEHVLPHGVARASVIEGWLGRLIARCEAEEVCARLRL